MLQSEPRPARPVIAPVEFAATPGEFSVVAPGSTERHVLESRVRSGFGTHFGACVDVFMPQLALYSHRSGATGIIGFRRASDGPLFLENYLERPGEREIEFAAGVPVDRARIAEVGQFVVDSREIAGAFFRDLVPFLAGQQFDWVCFTGTDRIRAILSRVGLHGLPIAAATADRVQPSVDQWGTYYDYDPVVVVGRLSDPRGSWCRDAVTAARQRTAGTS